MNLRKRCEQMLINQCQCPNDSEEDSEYCLLHNELTLAEKIREAIREEKEQNA